MADEWHEATLEQLGRIVTGKTPPTAQADFYGGIIPFVTPTDFDGRRIIDSTGRNLTDIGADIVAGAQIPADSVMVSCIGSDMGKVAISSRESVTNQQINSIIVNDENDALFVYYNLSQRRAEIKAAAGGSAQPILNKTAFGLLDILLPPLPEQRAIAQILGTLDDRIEANRRMAATLEEMARTLFRAWFVTFDPVRAKAEGRWRPGQTLPGLPARLYDAFPDRLVEAEHGEIPEGWRLGSIYEVAKVIYGAPFASEQFNTEGRGAPLIRIRDLRSETPGVWTDEQHPKGYLVKPGDIVVGMDGEFRAYLWGSNPAWLNQRVCVFQPKAGYSAAQVRNLILNPLAFVEATQVGTTVIHLGKKDIDNFKITVPAPNISEQFGRLAQPWYDKLVSIKIATRTIGYIRDLLLPKLVSGMIRVKDAEAFLKARGL